MRAAELVCALLPLLQALTSVLGSQVYRECPDKPVIDHFDPNRFQGLWYELRRQPNPFEPDSICVTGNVSVTSEGRVTIVNKWFNTANSQHVVLDGFLRRADNNSDNSKMIVNFSYNKADLDYWVLGTDYDSYAVVWSCMTTGENQHSGYAWVLGRSKVLSDDVWRTVHDVEERSTIDTSLSEDTRHSDCPTPSS